MSVKLVFSGTFYGRLEPSLELGVTNMVHDINKEHLQKSAVLCRFCSTFYLEVEPLPWSRGHDTGLTVHTDLVARFPVKITFMSPPGGIVWHFVSTCSLFTPSSPNQNISLQTTKHSRDWILSIYLFFSFSWYCIMYHSYKSYKLQCFNPFHLRDGHTEFVKGSWGQGILTWWVWTISARLSDSIIFYS